MITNEIRDYIERAPKRRWKFDGFCMVNNTHVRFKWLADIARGTLDCKINRRAGIVTEKSFFKYPIGSSIKRHARRVNVITYGRI